MIDVLFTAWNRLEFTRASFELLLRNTNWEHVDRLLVYDDGSTDGTREYLDAMIGHAPVRSHLCHVGWGSPVAIMNLYLLNDRPAALFAKVDNDIAVPTGWLDRMLDVLDRYPSVELLGMEAGQTAGRADGDGGHGWLPSSHIGGVGLIRSAAILSRGLPTPHGRFGWTEWQHYHQPVRGWIAPDIDVIQLDRMPVEPWLSLSRRYIRKLWQREWPLMDDTFRTHYEWLIDKPVPA